MNPRNISTNSLTITRDEESLFFVGLTPTPGLENLGLQTPSPNSRTYSVTG